MRPSGPESNRVTTRPLGHVEHLERAAGLVAARVDLAGLEKGFGVVVVARELAAGDEQHAPAGQQRVG